MHIETIESVDFLGTPRKEEYYFYLNDSELAEMQISAEGGMFARMKRIIQAQDNAAILKEFKDLILKSYGEISPDGKRFIKVDPITGEKLSIAFMQTEAYNTLFMELFQDPDRAWEFFVDILPEKMKKEIKDKPSDSKSLVNDILPSAMVNSDGANE